MSVPPTFPVDSSGERLDRQDALALAAARTDGLLSLHLDLSRGGRRAEGRFGHRGAWGWVCEAVITLAKTLLYKRSWMN
jgi:hypothetical protein